MRLEGGSREPEACGSGMCAGLRRRALAILDGVFPVGSMRDGLVRFPAVAHDVHADSADLLEVVDYDGVFMQMYDIDDATWEAALETASYKLRSATAVAAMAAGGGTPRDLTMDAQISSRFPI